VLQAERVPEAPRHALVAALAAWLASGVSCAPSVATREPSSGAATAATAAAAAEPPAPAEGPARRWVSGYYVGYQESAYPPDEILWSGLTHLFVGRVVPRADGSLDTTFDVDAQRGPALARRLVALSHQHGKKAVLMLGGAGTHDGWVGAAAAGSRAAFVASLARLAADYRFDGLDLDWEPITAGDQESFKALAESLRAAMPAAILAVPVAWVGGAGRADPFYGEIAPLFDQINVMSYGMAGPWPGWQSWHSSALHGESAATPSSIDASVRAYLAAGVPAAKLGIGVGFYGSCWSSPVRGPLERLDGARVVADDNVMTHDHIMTAYYSAERRRWDAAAKVPYLAFPSPHGPEGCTFVSYEDEESILEKGRYAKARGLGGAMAWTINEGRRPSEPGPRRDPLLQALGRAFLE
jgi:chitinase